MVRYPEKKYLLKYDLDLDLFNMLELEVNDVIPLRKVFILNTTEGKKILKRMEYSREKIEFINWCINSLNSDNICRFKTYSDGSFYKVWKEEYYVVMDCIEGRELNYSNPIEYIGAVDVLSEIHNSSKKVIDKLINNNELSNIIDNSLISKYIECIEDIKEMKKWVKNYRYPNEFDKLFLSNIDIYIDEMENSLKLLQKSKYIILRSDGRKLAICHNDLAEHNFLINEEGISLIDFDYATVDIRILDLADILLKGIKNVAFELEKGLNIIEEYNKENILCDEEYKLLYIIMLFPREFYSIVKNYYHKGKEWDEEVFINRFTNKINNDVYRREFLRDYKNIYKI